MHFFMKWILWHPAARRKTAFYDFTNVLLCLLSIFMCARTFHDLFPV